MDIRVLGPLQVVGLDGHLGGPRQQSLLVLLALTPQMPVSRDRIIDLIWFEPPPSAISTVQGYISHLRHALRGSGVALESSGAAYWLGIGAEHVDAVSFESSVRRGGELYAAGRAHEAVDVLGGALELWRGPALAGFLDTPFGEPAAAQLDELRMETNTLVWSARLSLGQQRRAVPELERLVRENPLNEGLWALLMRALYQSGRQGDSLAAFRRARLVLDRDLGVQPGQELCALEQAILRHDPDLDLISDPGRSLGDRPVRVARPRRPFVPITPFIGRIDELNTVVGLLQNQRAVTLVGPGGCGKTRLALHAGARVARLLDADDPVFVDLAETRDRSGVQRVAAEALGLGAEATPADFASAVGTNRVVVLDNCEHVLAAAAELASQLLRDMTDLRVLATSRQPLELRNETVWVVPPMGLAIEDAGRAELLACDAVALFLERSGRSDPGFVPDDEQLQLISEVCQALDGLPLAVELAATLSRTVPLVELSARLDTRLSLLGDHATDVSARQRTLLATLEWSEDLLDETQRRLLRRLGAFAGPFDLLAAERVCADQDLQAEGIFALLTALVHRSLVMAPRATQRRPYRMLETVRLFACSRLLGSEGIETRERHAQFHLAFAETAAAALTGLDQHRYLADLVAAEADTRAALDWLRSTQQSPQAVRLVFALVAFWLRRQRIREARVELSWVIDSVDVSLEQRVVALRLGALAAFLDGEADVSVSLGDRAGTLAREAGLEQQLHLLLAQQEELATDANSLPLPAGASGRKPPPLPPTFAPPGTVFR